jgi:uncharacterized protein
MSLNIKHNRQFQKFFVNVGGREAFLKYEKVGEGVLEFKIMYVPKNLRGVGIAEKVLKRALGFAGQNHFKIKTNCSYISNFISTDPELKDIVSQGPDMHTWVLHYN